MNKPNELTFSSTNVLNIKLKTTPPYLGMTKIVIEK